MPELPEIETVKLQLQKVLVGQICARCQVLSAKYQLKEIEGKEVKEVKRLGKVLLINFGKDLDLGFHFKMTGQLVYIPSAKGQVLSARVVGGHPSDDFVAKLPNKHTRSIFEFEKNEKKYLQSGKFLSFFTT